MARLIDELREDLAWRNIVEGAPVTVDYGWRETLLQCWSNRGSKAVLLYRLAHRLHGRGLRRTAAVLSGYAFHACHTQISPAARIAGGLRLPHPQGIVVGALVEVGKSVTLGQHVTLGGNLGRRDENGRHAPSVGEGASILAGSVVAGPVDVGARTIVAANSVVTRSLPSDVRAGGAPARVLRRTSRALPNRV